MNSKLIIDTSEIEIVNISLVVNGQTWTKQSKSHTARAQALLPLIDELLQEHKINIKDIKEIEVNPGPGSFTGLRVGLTIANTLGWILGIPVNSQKTPVLPHY